MPTILTLDLPTLHRRFIGFDDIFQELERTFQTAGKQDNYPPHNVIKTGETRPEETAKYQGILPACNAARDSAPHPVPPIGRSRTREFVLYFTYSPLRN